MSAEINFNPELSSISFPSLKLVPASLTTKGTFIFISLASILINLAIFLSTFSFKEAQKYYASIFCLVYLQIVWSSIVGFYVFNEFLNTYALLGAVLIVLSGIVSIPGQIRQVNEK